MNKTQKRQKAKERHARQQLKKEQERAQQAELFEEDVEDAVPQAESEELTKDYYAEAMPVLGPTSFEEMDQMEMAREQAHHVREVTWKVQDLVSNIMYDPMSSPDEKGSKLKAVASEFPKRVNKAMQMGDMMKKDMDLLEIEAILATDARHTGVVEKTLNFIKEKLSSAARENLSDSDFALVYEVDGKKVRKYPVHDAAHTRNALARAAQQMKEGGEGAADAKKAMGRSGRLPRSSGLICPWKRASTSRRTPKGIGDGSEAPPTTSSTGRKTLSPSLPTRSTSLGWMPTRGLPRSL
jgi:hypothetical protein